ncbi:beta-lactamase superfamily domain-containing protein [Cladorrhinum sp. PSN259]|nr:beta-lactamase superfamily domain-containing protein [Cladorrhinum sp. PSN259]
MLPLVKLPNLSSKSSTPPSHHVYADPTSPSSSSWSSYLPSWGNTTLSPTPSDSSLPPKPTSFKNPWPSWHKATKAELWSSFAWGQDDDPSIALALSHPHAPKRDDGAGHQAAPFRLGTEKPVFTPPRSGRTRAHATWLGHASVFLHIPLKCDDAPGSRGFTCLFDPIFSDRASPSQYAGPVRAYPPPCTIDDLPDRLDAVMISHNHYDHMDEESLKRIWARYRDKGVRFFVPLGNAKILKQMGIEDEGRIVEMDWWDGVVLDGEIKIWCVPAQHTSSRVGMGRNEALWSGWVVEREEGVHSVRCYFAGDTGYQFHGNPKWPPVRDEDEEPKEDEYPACPAFKEVRKRIGRPDLVFLPISVGATFAYLKSFVPLPDSVSPFPRHSAGVMGANHMPPWDAVRVFREMAEGGEEDSEVWPRRTVAMGMHWGTFVTDPAEVLKTLGQLEYACKRQGVKFWRGYHEEGLWERGSLVFAALDHGGSVYLPSPQPNPPRVSDSERDSKDENEQ